MFLLLSALVVGLVGCRSILGIENTGTGNDGGAGDGGGDVDARPGEPGFTFAVLTSRPALPLGGMNTIEIQITRTGGFAGDVAVAAMSPPTGVTVVDTVVPGASTTAEVVVGAQAPLVLGETISFDLVATAGELSDTVRVTNADITGEPGVLDTSFGVDGTGLVARSLGSDDNGGFYDAMLDGAGRVVVIGYGVGGLGAIRFAASRLTADGVIDTSFGGGLVRTDFESGSSGESAVAAAIGQQLDGRMIGIGWHRANSPFPPDVALCRYGLNGSVGDLEFGNYVAGKSRIDLGGDEEVSDGLVLDDSKIIAVGESSGRFAIMRATATGNLDTGFASGAGFVVESFANSRAEAVALDSRDRLVVAGYGDNGGVNDMMIVRYNAAGDRDISFGIDGVVLAGRPLAIDQATAVAVLPDDSIVVAGRSEGLLEVRKLTPDGMPDTGFGDQGVVQVDVNSARIDLPAEVIALPDGRILVVGNQMQGSIPRATFLVRLTRTGELDPFFNGDGMMELYIGENGFIGGGTLYDNHKVIIVGGNEGGTPGPGTFAVVVRMWM